MPTPLCGLARLTMNLKAIGMERRGQIGKGRMTRKIANRKQNVVFSCQHVVRLLCATCELFDHINLGSGEEKSTQPTEQ